MSMSGQCYMSAFLGGRSGNRGSCAGPCRLPFETNPLPEGRPGRLHHLSLKDNSVIDKLDKLQAIGVASAKIEGRLRTPEYVAAAVNACLAGREGRAYDRDLLKNAFSRSGFTSGYLDGKIDGTMFGVRSEADAEQTRKALPALRELKRQYPGYAVVAYINTTSELKTECDVCVTSSSAVKICEALDSDKILFIPDPNLGSYVAEKLPNKQFAFYNGGCPRHKIVTQADVAKARAAHPNALLLVHPECRPRWWHRPTMWALPPALWQRHKKAMPKSLSSAPKTALWSICRLPARKSVFTR